MFRLTEAQHNLKSRAQALAVDLISHRAAAVDQSEAYPWDNVKALVDAGFMGMTIPETYGGMGASYFEAALVVEELAKVCGVTARIVVEANMGAVGAIMHYGTDEQKHLTADFVLSGDKPAICITEPDAGSAATDMQTTATRSGNGYVLNGTKHWITGGGVSRLHLIFACLVENDQDCGIAGFLAIRGEDDGLIIGAREPAMGLRGIPETEIHFEDLWLPGDRILMPPEGVKHGFANLMTAYNSQRVGAGTVALGIAQGAFDAACSYSKTREQFGRPICEFQGLQWSLADMKTQLDAARLLLWSAALSADDNETGFPDALLAAEAKLNASELAVRVTNDALQMHGAMGYSRNLPLERMVRDARMFTIGGGTAQMLRNLIASRVLGRKLPQTRDGYLLQAAQ